MTRTKGTVQIHGMDEIEKNLATLFEGVSGENSIVKVGVLSGKNARTDGGNTNAEIGLKHEFGSHTENIPARSFLRLPIEHETNTILTKLATYKATKKLVSKNLMKDMCRGLGILAEAAIQKAFETGGFGQWKPLSAYTLSLRKKGKDGKPSSQILVDTAQLRRSVTSKVVKAGS